MKMKIKSNIPNHLPKKLTIAFWEWNWATDIQSGEAFFDLEKCFKDLVERGFNTVRIDALWSWIYNTEGKLRKSVEIIGAVKPGYSHYSPALTTQGEIKIDALKSILKFFELAEKHEVYVALTSWEYQRNHVLGLIADNSIREEILGIPIMERPGYLAKQCDRLITELKKYEFHKRIAYVELHNEISGHYFGITKNNLWSEQSKNVEKALAYLQEKHPGIIFTDDHGASLPKDRFFDLKTADKVMLHHVKNAQAIDHHLYALGVQEKVCKEIGFKSIAGYDNHVVFLEENLKRNRLLQTILKPDAIPWNEFKKYFNSDWFSDWWPTIYLYENMDVNVWDYLMFKYYNEYEKPMRNFWKNYIYYFYKEAKKRNTPLICDEGYFFYPPHNSNFEVSAVGKNNFEFIINHMLEAEYWGIMISTYTLPDCGLWIKEPGWLKNINNKILSAT